MLGGDLYLGANITILLLRLLSGYHLWLVAAASTFLHWTLLPAIPMLPLMLALRHRRGVGMAGISAAAYVLLFGGLLLPKPAPQIPCREDGADSCHQLIVMTYNAGAGLAPPNALAEAIRESQADLVGLQELSPEQDAFMRESLSDLYPYQSSRRSDLETDGPALFSRYPILSEDLLDPGHMLPYLQARIDVDGVVIVVLIVRAHPPHLGRYPLRLGKDVTIQVSSYSYWAIGETILQAAGEGSPTILLADLNATDQSRDYSTLRAGGMTDAFREAGQGFGLTFPARTDGWRSLPRQTPLLVRIDYIWLTGDFEVLRAWVGPHAGSDHLPVLSEVILPVK